MLGSNLPLSPTCDIKEKVQDLPKLTYLNYVQKTVQRIQFTITEDKEYQPENIDI